MYQRMIDYYPQVIQKITEFQAIIDGEYPEFNLLAVARDRITEDAYLPTMNLERVEQWEKILGITPPIVDSLESRRASVIARIRGNGKLNTAMINAIVNAFTNGTAESYVKDGTLYINIIPDPNSQKYEFAAMATEIRRKLPAHMGYPKFKMNIDVAKDTTLYAGCAVTYGESNIVNIVVTNAEYDTVFENFSAIVITHGETHNMEVL